MAKRELYDSLLRRIEPQPFPQCGWRGDKYRAEGLTRVSDAVILRVNSGKTHQPPQFIRGIFLGTSYTDCSDPEFMPMIEDLNLGLKKTNGLYEI